MWVFRWWKFIQKHRLQSFFQTKTTMLHHTLWLGQIMPEFNISCKCVWTSSTNGGGICLNHSLSGASSVTLITCFVEWVQPSSLGSKEKMFWYSAKRDWVESNSLGGQDSNLPKSNFSNSFSCLCFMVNLGVWMLWASLNAFIILSCICGSGTCVAATALATWDLFP